MKTLHLVTAVFIVLIASYSTQIAFAQFQPGGVNHPGIWYAGEGLKVGDYFSYKLCFVDYKDCAEFRMDLWMSGEKKVGTEEKWIAQVVVYDGN
ncbi:MAG: peptidase, partial [Nitrosopumilaceae archaeon]|nr:peptidase [Nitrosopumilaceae archaeon]